MVVGDLNDTQDSKALKALTGPASNPTLVNTTATMVPAGERYSYNYKGKSELIDHILVTPGFADSVARAGVRHINSDLSYGATWGTSPYGSSDHDSPYVKIAFPAAVEQAAEAAQAVQPKERKRK
jgi:predicted extracellular nuclease